MLNITTYCRQQAREQGLLGNLSIHPSIRSDGKLGSDILRFYLEKSLWLERTW